MTVGDARIHQRNPGVAVSRTARRSTPHDVNRRPTILAARHPNRRLSRGGRRAFTIADIVLVTAIIAVLGAIAVPRYSLALARYRVAAAGQRVAADLSLAQTAGRTTSAGQA